MINLNVLDQAGEEERLFLHEVLSVPCVYYLLKLSLYYSLLRLIEMWRVFNISLEDKKMLFFIRWDLVNILKHHGITPIILERIPPAPTREAIATPPITAALAKSISS